MAVAICNGARRISPSSLTDRLRRTPIVSDVELICVVSGEAIRAKAVDQNISNPGIVIVDTDSKKAFSWLRRGAARVGISHRAIAAPLLRRIRHNVDVSPIFAQTHHSHSADLTTRADESELHKHVTRVEMQRATAPRTRANFCRFGEIASRNAQNGRAIPRPSVHIPAAKNLHVVEWGGASFSPGWFARQFGCPLSVLHARRKDIDVQIQHFLEWTTG